MVDAALSDTRYGPPLPPETRETVKISQGLGSDAPTQLAASEAALAYTIVVLIGFLVVATWCVIHAIRNREILPVLMLVSGLLAVGFEPVVDTLGKVWYAADNPMVVYTSMGIPQPAFLLLGYSLFWGGTAYIGSRFVENGTSIWKIWAVVFVMDLIVEYLGVPVFKVGVYYGHSPFTLWEFPLWWAFVNATSAVVGIALLRMMEPRLLGWRKLGVLTIAPTAFGATHAASAWPVWVTLHSDVPSWAGWVAGTITIGMALFIAMLVNLLVTESARTG